MAEENRDSTTAILSRCLEDFEERGEIAVEEACASHPELAQELRQAVDPLRQLLAAASSAGEAEDAAPYDWSEKRCIGRFKLGEELGRGGMGVVYKAFDPKLGREVALKVLPSPISSTPQALARFKREGQALAQIQHPHIVPIHEIGTSEEDVPFLVMKYIEGSSLAKLIRGLAGKDEKELRRVQLVPGSEGSYIKAVVRILLCIADALHTAHENGIVHRDVKPENILVDKSGHPYLVDFGIARGIEDSGLTQTGILPGTPEFMAPEQIDAPAEVGPQTDVYGLGATLYYCLTMRMPFSGKSRDRILEQVRRKEPPAPRRIRPEIPRDIETICLTAMEKDPGRRYRSAAEFREDLDRFLEYRQVKARPLGPLTRFARLLARNRMVSAIAALAFVLVVGGPFSFALHEANARERIASEKSVTERERARAELAVADSLFRLAQLAAQHGEWPKALDYYKMAEEKGYVDKIEIALGRIEALEGSLEAPRALAILEGLSQRKDLGKHKARLLLLEADLAVNRIFDPDAKLDLVREALASNDLSTADEEFARAMLSKTMGEALGHLETARNAEPWHRRVNDLYGSLLLVSGRMREVMAFNKILRVLYRWDPALSIQQVFVIALIGSKAEIKQLVDEAVAGLDKRQQKWISFVLEAAAMIRKYDRISLDGLTKPGAESGLMTALGFVPFFFRASAFLRQERKTKTSIYFRVAPFVIRSYHRVAKVLAGLVFGFTDVDDLADAMEHVAKNLDDGMYYFGLGQYRLLQGRDVEAERAFEAAASKPSIALSRKTAVFYLLQTRIVIYVNLADRDSDAGKAMRARIVTTIHDCLVEQDLDVSQFKFLYRHAAGIRAAELSNEVALRWTRSWPKDGKGANALKHAHALLSKKLEAVSSKQKANKKAEKKN